MRVQPTLTASRSRWFRSAGYLALAAAWTTMLAMGTASAKEITWLELEKGLQQTRQKQRPALVWYTGKTKAASPHYLHEHLASSSLARSTKQFVFVRIQAKDLTTPYPTRPPIDAPGAPKKPAGAPDKIPTVAERLRLLDDPEAFVILDFRERVVRRYEPQKNPPRASDVRSDLQRIVARNRRQAQTARRVEKLLRQSAQAFAQKKVGQAVKKVKSLDEPKKRDALDPELREHVEEMIKDYRDQADKLFAKASVLVSAAQRNPKNSAKKYGEALGIYDQLKRDYPFRDVVEKANKQKGIVLTWMNVHGGVGPLK